MPSSTVLLFGDQTGDVLPSIKELSKISKQNHSLSGFLRKSTDRLRDAITNLPLEGTHPHSDFPFFDSPWELAESTAVKDGHRVPPALSAALLCISQLGELIV